MTTIALPAGFCPSDFLLRLQTAQRAHSSPFGGSEQVVDMLNDRWLISMTLPARTRGDAARVEAFISALRGMANTANLYHFARKVPRGTIAGSLTIVLGSSQGADLIYVQGASSGQTLLAGDMLAVNGMLLQVAADTSANGIGQINVTLANRLRKATTIGQAITYDTPTAPFRLISTSGVQHVLNYAEGISLDFAEVIL